MTKEKIIDLLYNEIGNPDYKTVGDYHKGIADILFAEIEKEKKEQAREIFAKIYNEIEYYSLGQIAIRQLAKEYGVEL